MSGDGDLPADVLIESRPDGITLLAGWGVFLAGGAMFLVDPRGWALVPPMMLGITGSALLISLTRRVARRIRPGRIGSASRWWQETQIQGAWFRPSVLRRAVALTRRRR